jgi:hypothetical protein
MPATTADLSLAGVAPDEVVIEALMTSSAGSSSVPRSVGRGGKRRRVSPPWKKSVVVLATAVATTAFAAPRPAVATEFTQSVSTPIHHFPPVGNEAFAGLVSGLQGPTTLEDELEDLTSWPAPSTQSTTPDSARALRRATREDPAQTLPPLVIDDGLGI